MACVAAGVLLCGLVSIAGAETTPGSTPGAPAADAALRRDYDHAFQRMLRDPTNLDLTFRFAELAIQVEDFEAAIASLERMLLLNPELPRINLELGVLYYRLGSFQMARTYLERALQGKDVPELVRRRVAPFMAEIEKRTARNGFTGSVFAGARWQSNANTGPTSDLVRTPLGNATLSDQYTRKRDINGFVAGTLTHTYDLGTQSGDRIETTAIGYFTRQAEQKQLDVGLLELRTGPRLALLPDSLDGATIRPFATANTVRLDERFYFTSLGGGIEVDKAITDRLSIKGSVEGLNRSYRNSGNSTTARELTGVTLNYEVGTHYALTPKSQLSLTAGLSRRNARNSGRAGTDYDLEAGYAIQYAAPFAVTAVPWMSSLSVGHQWATYDASDTGVDPNTTRHDRAWRVGALTSVGLTESWSLILNVHYTRNDSDVPNYQYRNWAVTTGANWKF